MRVAARFAIRLLATVSALWCLAATLPASAQPQAPPATPHSAKPPTVLFMCPHGAAKSVLASAYFQRVAKERGLNVRVVSGGTEPDLQVAPAVATHLTKNGYDLPIATPRKVTAEDERVVKLIDDLVRKEHDSRRGRF